MIRVAIICIGEVSLSTAILSTEPFRAANRLSATDMFDILYLAPGDQIETMRQNITFKSTPLGEATGKFDVVLMLACYQSEENDWRHAISWIRNQVRHGALACAIDYATVYFAKAGLLNGYQATTHWVTRDVFAEQFPKVQLCDKLFVIDRDRATSPGHMAVLELSLEILDRFAGNIMRQTVQNELVYAHRRAADSPQILSIDEGKGPLNQDLEKAKQLMRENISVPLSIHAIAVRLNVGIRDLQRIFKANLNQSPQQYYVTMRLQKARDLLHYSELSTQEVALSSGFPSYASFFRVYRSRFDMSPSSSRFSFRKATAIPNGRRVY